METPTTISLDNLTFKPFIGNHYSQSPFKLFILGESHYGSDKDNKETEFTSWIIDLYLKNRKGEEDTANWMSTFTKFHNRMIDVYGVTSDPDKFWNSLVFYNYVQEFIDTSRNSPTKDQFKKSLEPFLKVAEELNPDFIIVWGKRLWNKLPWEVFEYDKKTDKYYLLAGSKRIRASWVHHPSSSHFNVSSFRVKDVEINF